LVLSKNVICLLVPFIVENITLILLVTEHIVALILIVAEDISS